MKKKKPRYSEEALMDVFGTPRPSPLAVNEWKNRWRYTHGKIKVPAYITAIQQLNEADIDPLYYQFFSDVSDNHYIVFYNAEHEFFFKLHNNIT